MITALQRQQAKNNALEKKWATAEKLRKKCATLLLQNIAWTEVDANNGNRNAMCSMGEYYFAQGFDSAEIINYYRELIGGFPGNQYRLSVTLLAENRLEQKKIALLFLEELEKENNPDAQCLLSLLYQEGKLVQKNETKAFELAEAAAKAGIIEATMQVGLAYIQGIGVKKDEKKAIDYLKKAAEEKSVEAAYSLYQVYEKMSPPDTEKAFFWLTRAAEQKYVFALINLGLNYLHGTHITPDEKKGAGYIQEAAEKKHPYAQSILAYCYNEGRGVEKNAEKALDLYQAAATHGDEKAREFLRNRRKNQKKLKAATPSSTPQILLTPTPTTTVVEVKTEEPQTRVKENTLHPIWLDQTWQKKEPYTQLSSQIKKIPFLSLPPHIVQKKNKNKSMIDLLYQINVEKKKNDSMHILFEKCNQKNIQYYSNKEGYYFRISIDENNLTEKKANAFISKTLLPELTIIYNMIMKKSVLTGEKAGTLLWLYPLLSWESITHLYHIMQLAAVETVAIKGSLMLAYVMHALNNTIILDFSDIDLEIKITRSEKIESSLLKKEKKNGDPFLKSLFELGFKVESHKEKCYITLKNETGWNRKPVEITLCLEKYISSDVMHLTRHRLQSNNKWGFQLHHEGKISDDLITACRKKECEIDLPTGTPPITDFFGRLIKYYTRLQPHGFKIGPNGQRALQDAAWQTHYLNALSENSVDRFLNEMITLIQNKLLSLKASLLIIQSFIKVILKQCNLEDKKEDMSGRIANFIQFFYQKENTFTIAENILFYYLIEYIFLNLNQIIQKQHINPQFIFQKAVPLDSGKRLIDPTTNRILQNHFFETGKKWLSQQEEKKEIKQTPSLTGRQS